MKDPFLLYILLSALVGFLLPTSGAATDVLDWATKIAIFLLFLGYGARLSTAEAWAGLKHWRLHLTIFVCTFVVFPVTRSGPAAPALVLPRPGVGAGLPDAGAVHGAVVDHVHVHRRRQHRGGRSSQPPPRTCSG